MPRALITGISGQDGSYLAELLIGRGYEVWGLVRQPPGERFENLDAVREQVTLVRGDMLEPATLDAALHAARPDEVYHLAAGSFVPASWSEPVVTAQFIAVGTTALLETVRRAGAATRVFNASTAELFGAADTSPQAEDTPFRPATPYGVAKLHAQQMVSLYRGRHGMHASSGILFNHESPRRPARFVTRKVTRTAAAIKLGLASELRIGSLDATRDWAHARDVVEAMWLMLQQPSGDDYVVATGQSHSVRELVAAAFAVVDLDPDQHVVVDPAFVRPPDPVPLVGDAARARERLGWRPRTSFADMVAEMVEADLRRLGEQPALAR